MTPTSHAPLTEPEVLAAAAALVEAFAASRTTDYFAAFAPDATFVFHTEPGRLDSRAEYESLWGSWLAEGWSVSACTSTDAKVQLCGSTAVFSHTVQTTAGTPGGQETTLERETIVFTRSAGGVLAVHEHLSALPSSAAADA